MVRVISVDYISHLPIKVFSRPLQKEVVYGATFFVILITLRGTEDKQKNKMKTKKIIQIISVFAILTIVSCNNTTEKIQGEWILTECNEEPIDNTIYDFRIKFIGDSQEIITNRLGYSPYRSDTINISLRGNEIHYENDSTIGIIKKITDDILILDFSSSDNVDINKYKRAKTIEYYANEKIISPDKHHKSIIGEWVFTQTKYIGYDGENDWEEYGEPIGWNVSFSKDGDGYLIKSDNSVATFNWQITSNGNIIILTNTKYDDEAIRIKSMTKHTLHLAGEDEEVRLVRID